ncbi:DUF2124 domain-containing protein [Methanolobus sp.]|uniref:DUF2124 domain-containing protein n=1 Tax=Methanolobus sp. TaxID=1874737 RepID=UPI0025D0A9B5|nr:DUF2124 domain-containing protein [Methanolobus sp.]
MKVLSTSKGIGGQLTDFRKLVDGSRTITFVGSAGFCTPFAELMAYVIRGSDREMKFVPDTGLEDARSIVSTPSGMQLGEPADFHADTVVLLGGLAMPKIGVEPLKAKEMIDSILEGSEKKLILGVCFQSIFQNQNWTDTIDFDYIVDADLTSEVKQS